VPVIPYGKEFRDLADVPPEINEKVCDIPVGLKAQRLITESLATAQHTAPSPRASIHPSLRRFAAEFSESLRAGVAGAGHPSSTLSHPSSSGWPHARDYQGTLGLTAYPPHTRCPSHSPRSSIRVPDTRDSNAR
jgi:hypothetical protein